MLYDRPTDDDLMLHDLNVHQKLILNGNLSYLTVLTSRKQRRVWRGGEVVVGGGVAINIA